jgi:hypothetical protein
MVKINNWDPAEPYHVLQDPQLEVEAEQDQHESDQLIKQDQYGEDLESDNNGSS